jgi:hypothetical protein
MLYYDAHAITVRYDVDAASDACDSVLQATTLQLVHVLLSLSFR